jgi:beta-lactamase regulating signal transducer with metallopeptidase domain
MDAMAVVVDVAVVMALALLACRLLRRRSASLRHSVLTAALVVAAIAPALEAALPRWEIPVLAGAAPVTIMDPPLSVDATAPVALTGDAANTTTPMWPAVILTIWAAGFLLFIAGLVFGLVRLAAITRTCRPIQSTAWRERSDVLFRRYSMTRRIVVLESLERPLLLTWGLFRPRIIVPAAARAWTIDRIDVVLAHEMAHIARGDWALLIVAEIVRAAYWFNPLVWIACRRLRDEGELACDDIVLRRGVAATEYASHLLAVARHVLSVDRGWASAAAVANTSTLERRVSAMLDAGRNRGSLTAAGRACIVAAVLAAAVPVAAVTLTEQAAPVIIAPAVRHDIALSAPPAVKAAPPSAIAVRPPRRTAARAAAAPVQQKPSTLSGVVRDTSGAVVPGVAVTVESPAGTIYSTVSGANGAYAFKSLPPGTYQLRAALPGFASIVLAVTLTGGEDTVRSLEMRVGGLTEMIIVQCPAGRAAAIPRSTVVLAYQRPAVTRLWAAQGAPVRVGGNIMAPRRTKSVAPVCPETPLSGDGYIVILEATIGPDGVVRNLQTLRPKPGEQQQQALAQAAMDAVGQWEYTPTRLNNMPVPVILTVTVRFRGP